jgi:hypothetical protein
VACPGPRFKNPRNRSASRLYPLSSGCIDVILRVFGPVHAFTAYQQVFFERGQFRSIGDHAQVVPLKIGVGRMFHGEIVGEMVGIISFFWGSGARLDGLLLRPRARERRFHQLR